MSTLTPAQELEIRQEYERTQLIRTQECTKMKAAAPRGRNEMSATLSYLRGIDTYLASIERRLATADNMLYSNSLAQRDVAIERFNELHAADVAAAEAKATAAAKAKEAAKA